MADHNSRVHTLLDEGENSVQDDDIELDVEAKAWLQERVKEEAARLKLAGVQPLILPVKNYGIVRQEDHNPPLLINRVEIDTGFDLEKRIKQIMVSEAITYPMRSGFLYVHLILLTENMQMPLLVPYIYPQSLPGSSAITKKSGSRNTSVKNDLKEWLLINAKGLRARHSIHDFHDI